MSRALVILAISFAIGAALALTVRAGLHRPYAASDMPAPVKHGAAAAAASPAPAPAPADDDQHAPRFHAAAPPPAAAPAAPPAATAKPGAEGLTTRGVLAPRPGIDTVNTICPVCGFEVDLSLPTSSYHGKAIGFGCLPKRCKEKFDADPEYFGPAALQNRKAE
jgi:YHS domain-containing protein